MFVADVAVDFLQDDPKCEQNPGMDSEMLVVTYSKNHRRLEASRPSRTRIAPSLRLVLEDSMWYLMTQIAGSQFSDPEIERLLQDAFKRLLLRVSTDIVK